MSNVFIPNQTNAIAAASASLSRALPGAGSNVIFYNDGPDTAFVAMGADGLIAVAPALSTNVGAAGNATPIPAGAVVNLAVRPGHAHWAVICHAGATASVYCTSGTGE